MKMKFKAPLNDKDIDKFAMACYKDWIKNGDCLFFMMEESNFDELSTKAQWNKMLKKLDRLWRWTSDETHQEVHHRTFCKPRGKKHTKGECPWKMW